MSVRLKLFKSFCSSMYGSELWNLNNNCTESFCTAWRKALRRVLHLPYNAHCFMLPIASDTLPPFDEICKRSARFIVSCLISPYSLVRSVASYSILFANYNSPIASNALFLCRRYGWSLDSLFLNSLSINYAFFNNWHLKNLSDNECSTAMLLKELLSARDGQLFVANFSNLELTELIDSIATS